MMPMHRGSPTSNHVQDLKVSQAAIVKATDLQTQQSTEIERLNVALTAETTKVEKEYNAKLEVSKERLVDCKSIVVKYRSRVGGS